MQVTQAMKDGVRAAALEQYRLCVYKHDDNLDAKVQSLESLLQNMTTALNAQSCWIRDLLNEKQSRPCSKNLLINPELGLRHLSRDYSHERFEQRLGNIPWQWRTAKDYVPR